jgi:hypothetical protein
MTVLEKLWHPEARHTEPELDQRWRLMRLRKVASGPPAEGVAGADLLQSALSETARRQYRDCSDIRRLSVIGRRLDWCLKEIEKRSAGISDLPSRIVP